MADAGFFKGTSADQDRRFSDKELKLLKTMKFPPEFDKKVDMRKVNLSVIRPWIVKKVVELVGFEDEVVVEYAMGLLEDDSQPTPDPRKMQINLTGFLTGSTPAFMIALWSLLLEAQDSPAGVPRTFNAIVARVWTRYAPQNVKVVVADVVVVVAAAAVAADLEEMIVTISRETVDGVAEVAEGADEAEDLPAHPLPGLPHPEDVAHPPAPLPLAHAAPAPAPVLLAASVPHPHPVASLSLAHPQSDPPPAVDVLPHAARHPARAPLPQDAGVSGLLQSPLHPLHVVTVARATRVAHLPADGA
ncbi:PWI domain-containing protein [Ganoderma leucocontextum]|nr:PWI domain-containing protein [Ganoderma leucocontextum]